MYWTQAKAMQCELEERSSSFQRELAELKDRIEKTLAINLTAHKVSESPTHWAMNTNLNDMHHP